MCRPTGSYFWDSDLERGVNCNIANARKLQNITGEFNGVLNMLKNCLVLERRITSIAKLPVSKTGINSWRPWRHTPNQNHGLLPKPTRVNPGQTAINFGHSSVQNTVSELEKNGHFLSFNSFIFLSDTDVYNARAEPFYC